MGKELIEIIKQKGGLKDRRIEEAFKAIEREDFVPASLVREAKKDSPIPIGFGQTISQPYTVAFMLELLKPKRGEKILDVGSGSGFTTALLAYLVEETGTVYGTEIIPELIEFGKNNLAKYGFHNASIREAENVLGLREEAPFDKILVNATGSRLPQSLVEELKVGGIMVVPVKEAIWRVEKTSDLDVNIKKYEGFVFVPLREE